jgi:hypothetical protein
VVECLPKKCKALNLNPSTAKIIIHFEKTDLFMIVNLPTVQDLFSSGAGRVAQGVENLTSKLDALSLSFSTAQKPKKTLFF